MIGLAPIGLVAPGNSFYTDELLGLHVFVGGVDRTDEVVVESLEVDDQLSRRNTAEFTVVDPTLAVKIDEGRDIQIWEHEDLQFRGTVDGVSEVVDLAATVKTIDVECVDFNQLADRHTIANTYQGMLAGDIVRALVETDTELHLDGVSTDGVSDGFLLDDITFPHVTVATALDRLAELGGWIWYIDNSKVLWFFERAKFRTPNDFGDDDKRFTRAIYTRDRSEYYNRLFLRGGKSRTVTVSQEFVGDDKNQSFQLSFEAARAEHQPNGVRPKIEINDVEQTKVGVRGKDDEDAQTPPDSGNYDFEWLWSPEEKEISQNLNLTPLTPSQTLRVTYVGLFETIVQAENRNEQKARAAIEGGTGIYEEIVDEKDIDGATNIVQRAEALLSRNDRMHERLSVSTRLQLRYRAGQVMHPKFAAHDIDDLFLVERVRKRWSVRDDVYEQDLRLIHDERVASDVRFWRQLRDQGRTFSINAKQQIQVLKSATEYLKVAQLEASLVTGNQLIDDDLDEYSIARVGRARLGFRYAEGLSTGPKVG